MKQSLPGWISLLKESKYLGLFESTETTSRYINVATRWFQGRPSIPKTRCLTVKPLQYMDMRKA
jgi:hypothetical protein